MQRFIEIVKSHPYLIGGAVLLIVVWWMFSGSSSGSDGGETVQAGATNSALSANTAIALGQQQANAAVSIANIQASAQTAAAQAAVEATKSTNETQASVLNNYTAAQIQIAQGDAAAAGNLATINAGLQTSLANIALQGQANNNAKDITLAGMGYQYGYATQQLSNAASLESQQASLRYSLLSQGISSAQALAGGGGQYGAYIPAYQGVLGNIQQFLNNTSIPTSSWVGFVAGPTTYGPGQQLTSPHIG